MSSSQVPSPSHSQGANVKATPPKWRKTRRTRSVSSGTSNVSLRLTAVIPDSFPMSPLPTRWSVLNDDTDIQIPGRPNWWKRLTDNSRAVTDVMEERENEAKAAEELDVEILSQEKENMSLNLPESSDGESIHSIVLPQRELFKNRDTRPQKKLKQIIHRKESLGKMQSFFDQTNIDKDINVMPKKLFNRVPKPKTKSVFNAALFNASPNKSVNVNNSVEKPAQEVQQPVRNMFGYRPGLKRKNIYAEFVLSDSNDEFSEIQPRIFGFQRKNDHQQTSKQRRLSSPTSVYSSASNITDVEMGEWNHLPSSTMLDHQLEEAGGTTPIKRIRLSRLSKSKKSEDALNKNNSLNTSRRSDKSNSKVHPEVEEINIINTRSQSFNKSKDNSQVEPKSINSHVITNKSTSVRETSQKNSSKLTHKVSMDEILTEEDMQVELINAEHEKTLTEENQHHQVDDENFTLEFENDDEQIFDINVKKFEENQNISYKAITHNEDLNEADNMHSQESNDPHIASEIIESANVEIYSNQKDSELNKTDEISRKKDLLKSPEAVLHEKSNGEESYSTHGRNTSIGKSKTIPNDLNIRPSLAPTRESSGFTDRTIGSSAEDSVWDSHKTTRQTLRQTFGTDFTPRKSLRTLVMERSAKRQANEENLNDQVANKLRFHADVDQSKHESSYNKNANQAKQQTDFDANPIPPDQVIEKNKKVESDKDKKQNEKPDAEQIECDRESKQNDHFESDPKIEDNIESVSVKDLQQMEESEIDKNVQQNEEFEFDKDIPQYKISELDKDEEQNNKSESDKDNQQIEISEKKEKSVTHANIQQIKEFKSLQNQAVESDKESEHNEEPESDENIELYDKSESEKDIAQNEENDSDEESKSYNEQEQNEESELEQNEEVESELDEDVEQNREFKSDEDVPLNDTSESQKDIEEVESESDEDVEQNGEFESDEDAPLNDKSESQKDIEEVESESDEDVEQNGEFESFEDVPLNDKSESEKDIQEIEEAESVQNEDEESESSNEQEQNEEFESFREPEQLEVEKTTEDADYESAKHLRRENLEKYLQKVREEKAELRRKVQEKLLNSLKEQPKPFSIFKVPDIPKQQRAKKVTKKAPKPKLKTTIFTNLDHLPAELFEDLKYKPPKRFQGRNAPWITKRLYKFLEDKLQLKYDYHARVRAEKLVEKLYVFAKDVRKCARAAPPDAVSELKLEMARLGVVATHHEFYRFFHEFMPREIRIRVNPDIMNKIPLPRNVFGNIMEE